MKKINGQTFVTKAHIIIVSMNFKGKKISFLHVVSLPYAL